MIPARFFLCRDCDAHWYIVPVERRAEWDAWRTIPDDDEQSWEAPEWARQVGGSPSLVTFTEPEIG